MTSVYKTISGDTWDIISYKNYNSEYYIDELITANRKHITTAIFNSGVEIIIPEVTQESTVKLPPWKQGK